MRNRSGPFGPVMLFLLIVCLVAAPLATADQAYGVGDSGPRAVFTAGVPDANGYFTVDLTIYNARFNAFQFCVRFDPEVVKTASFSDGSITDRFPQCAKKGDVDWMATVGTSVSLEKGLLDFTGYVTPGQNGTDIIDEKGDAVANGDGLKVYSFRFKKVGTGEPNISLATSLNGENYNEALPDGGGLARAGLPMATKIQFDIPEAIGKSSETVQNTDAGNGNGAETTGSADNAPETGTTAQQTTTAAISRADRIKDTIILQIGNYAAAVEGTLSRIDPSNEKVMPYVKNQRTYVPLAFLSETLKAKVLWDGDKEEVTVQKDGTTIVVPIGADYYLLNGTKHAQDAPAEVRNQRTFVPIAFIGRALGNEVFWEPGSEAVIITPADKPWQESREAEKSVLNDSLLIMSPLIRSFNQ